MAPHTFFSYIILNHPLSASSSQSHYRLHILFSSAYQSFSDHSCSDANLNGLISLQSWYNAVVISFFFFFSCSCHLSHWSVSLFAGERLYAVTRSIYRWRLSLVVVYRSILLASVVMHVLLRGRSSSRLFIFPFFFFNVLSSSSVFDLSLSIISPDWYSSRTSALMLSLGCSLVEFLQHPLSQYLLSR